MGVVTANGVDSSSDDGMLAVAITRYDRVRMNCAAELELD